MTLWAQVALALFSVVLAILRSREDRQRAELARRLADSELWSEVHAQLDKARGARDHVAREHDPSVLRDDRDDPSARP